jgi:hypothetical protein
VTAKSKYIEMDLETLGFLHLHSRSKALSLPKEERYSPIYGIEGK